MYIHIYIYIERERYAKQDDTISDSRVDDNRLICRTWCILSSWCRPVDRVSLNI